MNVLLMHKQKNQILVEIEGLSSLQIKSRRRVNKNVSWVVWQQGTHGDHIIQNWQKRVQGYLSQSCEAVGTG